MESYTAAELQRETGFDRRTIAYYVHEGLLPKVGRRGSRTRYPKLVRDRLLFIRQVRGAEQRGTVAPVSLRDLRKIFEQTPPELISGVADGRIPVTPEAVAGITPRFRSLARRRAAIEDRWGPARNDRTRVESPRKLADSSDFEPRQVDLESPEAHDLADSSPAEAENLRATDGEASAASYRRERVGDSQLGHPSELGELLAALQEIAEGHSHPSPTMDRWLRIDISPDITLSVRGVTDEAAPLLERAVHCLRRLMRGRAESETGEEEDES